MVAKPISRKVLVAFLIPTLGIAIAFTTSKFISSSTLLPASQSLGKNKINHTLKDHYGWVYTIAISPDGKTLVSGTYQGQIKIWNLHTGQLIRTIQAHADAVHSLSISTNCQILASGSWDNRIKLWDLQTGELIRTITGHSDNVESVAISPNGKILASGSWDTTVKIWDLETGKNKHFKSS